jgi:TPR repeat protein
MKLIGTLALAAGVLSLAALAQNFDAGLRAYEQHDYSTAMKEWRPLAERGNDMAQFNLALLYYDGKGVPQDYAEAAQWFERAANQGYARAQRNLAEMYATGQGVKRDYVQAYKWFSICAASGNQTCADHRDWAAKKLSGSKLSAAQRLASEWKPVKSGSSAAVR